jgi:hypothetical protein
MRASFAVTLGLLAVAAACTGETTDQSGGATKRGGGQTSGGTSPPASTCGLPSTGGPLARVANFVPDDGPAVDVCMRPALTQDWGTPVLFGNGGDNCQPGFAYPQVSVAFSAPASTIDMKLVPWGSLCTAAPLTEGDGLALASGVVTTLVRIGGGATPERIVALPEDAFTPGDHYVRFVNAAPGQGPIYVGEPATSSVPGSPQPTGRNWLTSLDIPGPIPFGAAPPAGESGIAWPIDDHGYLHVEADSFTIAAATAPTGSTLWLWTIPATSAASSLYTIGVLGDAAHPIEVLGCNEGMPTAGSGQTLSCTTQVCPATAPSNGSACTGFSVGLTCGYMGPYAGSSDCQVQCSCGPSGTWSCPATCLGDGGPPADSGPDDTGPPDTGSPDAAE